MPEVEIKYVSELLAIEAYKNRRKPGEKNMTFMEFLDHMHWKIRSNG
jgi:hypothetical protein